MSFNYPYTDDENSIHQRQGTLPLGLPQEEPQAAYPSPEELVKNIFTLRPPEPVFDKAKQYRLQKLGRLNALGRSMGVLGDVLSLGLGANVRRRQPDTISPALYASFEGMMDKYKTDGDAHRFALYQKQMQDAQLGISHGYRREDQAWRQQAHNDELQAQRDKNNLDFEKWKATWEQRERQNQATNQLKERKLNQDWELKTAEALADYWKNNTLMEINIGGRDIKLTEGQYRKLLSEAKQDMNWAGMDFKTMMEPYLNYPIEGLKNIVQRYSEYKYKNEQLRQQNSPQNLSRQQPIIDQMVGNGSFQNPYPRFQGQIPLRDAGQNPPLIDYPLGDLDPLEIQEGTNTAPFDSTKYLRH